MSEENLNNDKSVSSDVLNSDGSSASPPKKSFLSKLVKWFLFLFVLLLLLLAGIFIFIQTDTFDKIALGIVLDKVNESLKEKDSEIYAASLEGNIFRGIILKDGSVRVKNDTLLKFSSLETKYDIFALLDHGISVQDLIIKQPQINLTKVKDKNDSLVWNSDYFLSSDKPADTSASVFDWKITADNIQIENGSIRMLGNKNSDSPVRDIKMRDTDTLDLSYLDLNDLNLKLSGKYFPDSKELGLKNLSFKTNSKFNLKELSLSASVNEKDTVTQVKDFTLITDRSEIKINEIFMTQTDPLAGIDYENFDGNKTRIDFSARNFNFDDLKFFLPDLNFLDSTVSLDLIAEGYYENLEISKLKLITPNSKYSFAGNVKNLDEPEKLYFDVSGKDIEIDPKDLKIILPGLDLPDYTHLGIVRIPSITYTGEPDRFKSVIDLRTAAGNVTGNADLDLSQNIPKYKGDLSVTNFNIGKVVKDKTLESNINGDFIFETNGFDYKTSSGRLNYRMNRTRFFDQDISRSEGQLNFNKGNVGLNVNYNSAAINTKVAGTVNISNVSSITYNLKGTASGLNIASFTKDNSLKSNMSFDFDINGRGFAPDAMAGEYKINLNRSEFADFEIPATPLEVIIGNDGSVKKLSMKSDFVDVSASGSFDFTTLGNVISANTDKIVSELKSKLFTDSSTASVQNTKEYSSSCKNINMEYSLDIKNLEPLYTFTGNDSVKFNGKITGNLSDSCGIFALTTEGKVRYFSYKDTVFLAKDGSISLDIRNNLAGNGLNEFKADINIFADTLLFGKFPLDSTRLQIKYFENKNNFTLSSKQDSTLKFYTDGSIKDSLIAVFDTLSARYQDFLLTNYKDLIIKYDSEDSSSWINFRQFSLNSLNQKLTIAGKYSFTDSSNFKVSADNVKLATYQKLLNKDIDTANIVSGNLRRMEIFYKGTNEDPDLHVEANSDVLRVGGTRIGRLDALFNYRDNELKPEISFSNLSNAGSFKLSGNIPFINPLSKTEPDSAARIKIIGDKTVNLVAVADNFQLKVLQQLLPYTRSLEGILNGKIELIGTSGKPVLTGDMNVDKGKFYVTINKMNYNFHAALSTQDEKLLIKDSKIFVPDEPSRFITTTGYIDFTNLIMNEINLDMSGDLKAFDKKNGQTELGISGDLWVGSGTPKLKLFGNSERIDLTGNLLLVKGNVVFNPFIQQAYNVYSDDFNYGVIIDSVKTKENPLGKIIMQRHDSDVIIENLNLNPFEKILYTSNNSSLKKKARSESGKFFYSLYITTSENVFLKFIVNEKSQQEFFGAIKTDLYVDNKDNYQMSGRGTVYLGDNCYYKFFRKFDATGKAVFNGPIADPELDITAVYKGYATSGTGSSGEQNLQDVIIDLTVRGNASNPVLTVTLDRGQSKESGSNATSDAIAFLLFGTFKDQLSFDQSTSLGANIGASYLSNILSSSIENVLPWIINANINYIDSENGNIANNTDIRFTAAIGDAIVRFGGQIFKGIANTDIVIDYPLNKLLKIQSLSNNLFIRLEKVYDPFSENSDISNTSGTRAGALIFYKFKF